MSSQRSLNDCSKRIPRIAIKPWMNCARTWNACVLSAQSRLQFPSSRMKESKIELKSDRGRSTGVLLTPPDSRDTGVLLAHGAGGNMHASFINFFHRGIAEAGYPCLKFNFYYSEARKKVPDQ